jgi:hypothetical protein
MRNETAPTGSVYEVRLHGIVSPRVLDGLCTELEMRADTVQCGDIPDQAALHGLLARLSDLVLEMDDVRHKRRRSGDGLD